MVRYGRIGNEINNYGTWFTVDNHHDGNEIHGSSHDVINNYNFIQAAFDPNDKERSTFDVNEFYNGGTPDQGGTYYDGLMSLVDGQAGDKIKIEGNFHGGNPLGYNGPAYLSEVAIDTRLGPDRVKGQDYAWNSCQMASENPIASRSRVKSTEAPVFSSSSRTQRQVMRCSAIGSRW